MSLRKAMHSQAPSTDAMKPLLVEDAVHPQSTVLKTGHSNTRPGWRYSIQQLHAFISKYGHCLVPKRALWPEDDVNGYGLGSWVVRTRGEKKKGRLPASRIAELDSLGFVWDLEKHREIDEWQITLRCLREFKERHGHLVIRDHIKWPEGEAKGIPLGRWVRRLKEEKRKGELCSKRVAELESLGFSFLPIQRVSSKRKVNISWLYAVQCFSEFKERYGHVLVPPALRWPEDDPDGFRLGHWVIKQRRNRRKDTLSAAKIVELETLGFTWSVKRTRSDAERFRQACWNRGFENYRSFWTQHGHGVVPRNLRWPEDDEKGFRLGAWVARVRRAKKRGELSDAIVDDLVSLGFVWEVEAKKYRPDISHRSWQKSLRYLREFKEQHGHLCVPYYTKWPKGDAHGSCLGIWVIRIRAQKKQGKLSAQHIESLTSLGFVWEGPQEGKARTKKLRQELVERRKDYVRHNKQMSMPQNARWDRAIQFLKDYKERYGHVCVPFTVCWPEDDINAYPLGRWVAAQRSQWKKGKLLAGRIGEMDSLGFVWSVRPAKD